MSPTALQNLYCTPQDLYEQNGINAAQLSLDDGNIATGQTIQTTSDSPIGSTTIACAALQYPLLAGSNLVFQLAGMPNPVEATLSAVALAGATSLSVVTTVTDIPSGAQATDNGTNVWLGGLLLKACKYATEQVQIYCLPRYNDSALATSWSVNRWAIVLGSRWLGKRLRRALAQGTDDDYKEAMAELKNVQNGLLQIPNIGTRTSGWPYCDNMTLVDYGTYRKLRVEPVISDQENTQFPSCPDWGSYAYLGEW